MNKRNRVIKIGICVVGCLCMLNFCHTVMSSSPLMAQWGSILKDYASGKKGDNAIYAIGNTGMVLQKEVDQAVEYYEICGMNSLKAKAAAVEYMMEREALYQEALRRGYSVTDAEIYNYLDELKDMMNTASNKDDVNALIEAFGSEEDYWKFQFTVYQKNLPIQKMVSDLRNQFVDEQIYSDANFDGTEDWNTYFESFKDRLVDSENFKWVQ